MLPTSSDAVRPTWKSPNSRWPAAAEATRGIAWTRSVPTNSEERSIGYSSSSTIIREPEPTDVIPTTSPPTTPITTVGSGRSWNALLIALAVPSAALRACSRPLAAIEEAASSNATPRTCLMRPWTTAPSPNWRNTSTPAKAAGTDPTMSQRTRPKLTVPRRRWTPPPTGFMITAATRSLDTAASGWTLNTSTSNGVMSAPPPIPVRPTVKPTNNPAAVTYGSTCKRHLPLESSVSPHQLDRNTREHRPSPGSCIGRTRPARQGLHQARGGVVRWCILLAELGESAGVPPPCQKQRPPAVSSGQSWSIGWALSWPPAPDLGGSPAGKLHGMQGVRGSNPLSSTPSQRPSRPSTAHESPAPGSKSAAIAVEQADPSPTGASHRR